MIALPRWFRGHRDTRPGPLRGLEVRDAPDARGWQQALCIDARRRQIATPMLVEQNESLLAGEQVTQWNAAVSDVDRLLACFVCDGTAAVPPLLGGLFEASGKAERKDVSELAAALALEAPALYDAAEDVGWPARPAREVELAARCGRLLGATAHSLEELADLDWSDRGHDIAVGSQPASVFTLWSSTSATTEAINADISGLMADWDVDGHVWRTRWMRPFVDPAASAEVADRGRTWSTITVTGGPDVDELFIAALAPKTRLCLNRQFGRQGIMLASALGLGVTGFQNTVIEQELPS